MSNEFTQSKASVAQWGVLRRAPRADSDGSPSCPPRLQQRARVRARARARARAVLQQRARVRARARARARVVECPRRATARVPALVRLEHPPRNFGVWRRKGKRDYVDDGTSFTDVQR